MSSLLKKPVKHIADNLQHAPIQYKSYTITRVCGVQIGYLTPGSRNESYRVGKGRIRVGYEVTGGHLEGAKWCDTMRDAREYIDVATAEPNA